jgi:sporulation protein YlmC with PRC-barrel domain
VKGHPIRIVSKRDDAPAVAPGLLAHLSDLDDDYMIADPVPDMRDWVVTLPDGRRVGVVDDIVIDTTTMTAKYVEVRVDAEVLLGDENRWVLVPVEAARVDADGLRVIIEHVPVGGLADVPRPDRRVPTAEEQSAILRYFEIVEIGAPRG